METLVLPRLGLVDLQHLGQACGATHALVISLSDSRLRRLLQVWLLRCHSQDRIILRYSITQ